MRTPNILGSLADDYLTIAPFGPAVPADAVKLVEASTSQSRCSRGPDPSDVLREEIVDEGLVAQPPPFGLTPDGVEYFGVDSNGDQPPGRASQGGPPDSSHRPELRRGSLRDVGEVNPAAPSHGLRAPCGSPGAR